MNLLNAPVPVRTSHAVEPGHLTKALHHCRCLFVWHTVTVCTRARLLCAEHYDGTSEYDAHNLYGVAMAMAHYKAYTAATGKRPFNIIR